MQLYETCYAPLAGLLLLGTAWRVMFAGRRSGGALRLAKILLAAGVGHIGFGFMRLTFFAFYRDDLVWFVFWEELTELVLIVGVLVILWLFRPEFFARWSGMLFGPPSNQPATKGD